MGFSENLKDLRKEKTLTQKELATYLGLTANCICEWENQRSEPSMAAIAKMCTLFDVSADYLLGRSDDLGGIAVSPTAPALSAEERQLLALFGQMTHVQRVKVLAYSEGLLSTGSGRQSQKTQA